MKRLVTIEDLGNIRVLFTDKTGTLTQGTVAFAQSLDGAGLESTRPLLLGLVCNEATLSHGRPVGGNALDEALQTTPHATLLKYGADGPSAYHRLGILPFDHERQLVSATVATPDGTTMLVTKGDPEAVLARCVNVPGTVGSVLDGLFRHGVRVIAVASRETIGLSPPSLADERDLHLAGFLTFNDPPKAKIVRRLPSSMPSASK